MNSLLITAVVADVDISSIVVRDNIRNMFKGPPVSSTAFHLRFSFRHQARLVMNGFTVEPLMGLL